MKTTNSVREGRVKQVFLEPKLDPVLHKVRTVYSGFGVNSDGDVDQVFTGELSIGTALKNAYDTVGGINILNRFEFLEKTVELVS